MKKQNKFIIALTAILSLHTTALAFDFSAEPAFPNKINSPYFTFELKPGTSTTETIKITNTAEESTTFKIDAVDSMTTTEGKTGFKVAGQNQANFGKWVTIKEPEITLNPSEEKIVEFQIDIPTDASLGDYIGAVTVTTFAGTKENVDNSKMNIGISQRFAVKSFLKVTDNPQIIEKAANTNSKTGWAQYYFLGSAGIFAIALGIILAKSGRKSKK